MRKSLRALSVAAVLAFPATAPGIDLRPETSVRGWFFSVEGTIEDTDLDALDFDSIKGQPELRVGFTLGGRHHIEVSYFLMRREEEGTASGQVFGVFPVEGEVSIDLHVDYLRGHYGYSLIANDWVDLQPFLEIAYLREETDIRDSSTGNGNRQDESAVFPLPGAEIVLLPTLPVRPQARFTGIGTGQGHLIDVEVGLAGEYGMVIGGFGYRHVDFLVENDDRKVADVELSGIYVEGGLRF